MLLSIARTNTFTRRKIFLVSTPTVHGISRIEKEFESSDKRYFFVPCPYCNYYQVLKWSQVKWEDKDPATTHYVCSECQNKIYNHQKTEMLSQGEWRGTNITANNKTVGSQVYIALLAGIAGIKQYKIFSIVKTMNNY